MAFQLKELARSREREDEKFILHMFLMQEIRARRALNTVVCEIKGMSKDLKEIVGRLENWRALGETESSKLD